MVLQDNLCKAVEAMQTTTTGRFFGKARTKSLEAYGMPADASHLFDEADADIDS